MPARRTRIDSGHAPASSAARITAAFDAVRERLEVPEDFPTEVVAEAERAAAAALPDMADRTDIPFVTIDPVGSMDLDQAMHLTQDGDGWLVRYAIADVPTFVAAGGALDAETRRRGQTIYAPDKRTPLHPPVLSEAAASLLEGQVRPAFVWELRLDAAGALTGSSVARALVRSVARLDYASVQRDLDAGTADPMLGLLRDIGRARQEQERLRGGASLPMPEQEVHVDEQGRFSLELRPVLDVEDWNAQISLLTGMAAADMMMAAGIGIVRTMPPAAPEAVDRLRRQAAVLHVPWPQEQPYGEWLRSLDHTEPHHLALIHAATSLFRGAGYTPFDGELPENREHAALAASYAHVTAPLRRLVDRFGLAVCAAVSAGEPVPDWVRAALPELPELMASSDRRAKGVERACTDIVEAAVLESRVGEVFEATVVEKPRKGPALVQLTDPAVLAPCEGDPALGATVAARLTTADLAAGRVVFTVQA